MLGTLGRHRETALLGKAFFVGVLGIFQPLHFHANILQEFWIRTEFLHENPLQIADSQTSKPTKTFPTGHLVQ